MKHPDKFKIDNDGGSGTLPLSNQEVADKLSSLRYDVLADILIKLACNLEKDGQKDASAGRIMLGSYLMGAGYNIKYVADTSIKDAWNICKVHTDE